MKPSNEGLSGLKNQDINHGISLLKFSSTGSWQTVFSMSKLVGIGLLHKIYDVDLPSLVALLFDILNIGTVL